MFSAKFLELSRRNVICICLLIISISTIMLRVMYCKIIRNEIIFSDDDYLFNFTIPSDGNVNRAYVKTISEQITNNQTVKNILRLRDKIKYINRVQKINNNFLYTPVSSRTTIIIIQMHVEADKVLSESYHLAKLLEALAQVVGISEALLIFSQDYFDDYINFVIETKSFTKYMQIYYPYSTQVYPDRFPGNDSKFCSEGYQCMLNDTFRDARLVQQKHFWWWQMNHVFSYLDALKRHNGYFLFLKHNQYVAKDLIYMLELMSVLMKNLSKCEIINLGAHRPHINQFHLNKAYAFVDPFGTTEFNYGLALSRCVWNRIKIYKKQFCYVNDVRWQESLKSLGNSIPDKLQMMASEGPRVLPADCDNDKSGTVCDPDEKAHEAIAFFELVSKDLFPRDLEINATNKYVVVTEKGKWEDVRDREFCMLISDIETSRFNI